MVCVESLVETFQKLGYISKDKRIFTKVGELQKMVGGSFNLKEKLLKYIPLIFLPLKSVITSHCERG